LIIICVLSLLHFVQCILTGCESCQLVLPELSVRLYWLCH